MSNQIKTIENHSNSLEILRDGCFEWKFKFTKCSECTVKEFCNKIYPEHYEFINKLTFEDNKYTPVELFNLALQYNFEEFINLIKKNWKFIYIIIILIII